MLAGYLPFDDDPSNPEGDNITLLYKYIVNTPLTFPEYITPVARDLLRNILVAEPSARATLEEVVQHSWLEAQKRHIIPTSSIKQQVRANELELEAQDMIRSSSERPAAHTSFALPQDNHLVPTGFSKNSSMAPTQAPTSLTNKRHTVQIEYSAPMNLKESVVFTSAQMGTNDSATAEALVETLSIPAAPAMARGVSHSGEHSSPRALNKVDIAQRHTGQVPPRGQLGREGAKLPVPVGKPRPTSFHPAYYGAGNKIMQPRIPSDPTSLTPVKSSSGGSHVSRVSMNSWSGPIQSKTASPRSTNQNASGELYSAPRNELTTNLTVPKMDESKRSKVVRSHRRNSSSISSMFGKLWQSTNSMENKSNRRDSSILKNTPMDSIGETGTFDHNRNGLDVSTQSSQSDTRRVFKGDHGIRQASADKIPSGGFPINSEQSSLPIQPYQFVHEASDTRERFSSTAARRVMNFFTSRRKEKAGSQI